MKAVKISTYGGPEVFQVVDVPKPQIAPGHVLIRVQASSVNPIDTIIRSGLAPDLTPEGQVLHGDVAGMVEEVGDGVQHLHVGDAVYACAGGFRGLGGALAEYMLADANLVQRRPSSLTAAEAAALPLVSITAWEALMNRARIVPGQTILVHGGAGGVGHIGIQLAKSVGCQVWTTVSTEQKRKIVLELGADGVINYRSESVQDYVKRCTQGQGFDVVFNTVGGPVIEDSFQAAIVGGTVTTVSCSVPDSSLLSEKALSVHMILMLLPLLSGHGRARHGAILRELATLVDAGKVRPLVDAHQFGFSEVGKSHEYLESGAAVGKVVLMNDLCTLKE